MNIPDFDKVVDCDGAIRTLDRKNYKASDFEMKE